MAMDLYLATYCVGSVEEILTPLHKVCSLLLPLRVKCVIALFGLCAFTSSSHFHEQVLSLLCKTLKCHYHHLFFLFLREGVHACCGCSQREMRESSLGMRGHISCC